MALTPRGRDLAWLAAHRGITENPPYSNRDDRPDGITAAQKRLGSWLVGLAWCGTWAANGLLAAGVKGVSYRLASVALIEDDARAGRAPFHDWLNPYEWRKVLRGDLVVLFGRGVHVETVRGVHRHTDGQIHVLTDGGNTSPGNGGSQSNGGGAYKRVRPLRDVHGFARVDYPGGWTRRGQALMGQLEAVAAEPEVGSDAREIQASDRLLLTAMESRRDSDPDMFEFRDALKGALKR